MMMLDDQTSFLARLKELVGVGLKYQIKNLIIESENNSMRLCKILSEN